MVSLLCHYMYWSKVTAFLQGTSRTLALWYLLWYCPQQAAPSHTTASVLASLQDNGLSSLKDNRAVLWLQAFKSSIKANKCITCISTFSPQALVFLVICAVTWSRWSPR